uniref:Uncharacterized protein n=1 Tax=Mimiviridae sp. ChoanoV1 TaxID=2596887 RepID=A0A5B8IF60_9VIRU|nr:hypothetical protein 2_90 [Mimiviridae sp. ChoanoV1]
MNYFIVAIFILLVILVIYLICYTSKKNEKFSTKIDYLEWKENNDSVTFKNEVSNNYNNIIVSNNNNELYEDYHQINKNKLINELNNLSVLNFIENISNSCEISIEMDLSNKNLKDVIEKDLIIKYQIFDSKNNIKFENYIHSPVKIDNNVYLKINESINLFINNQNHELGFERLINLDLKDGFNQNPENFNLKRQLYLTEGEYNIKIHFISSNTKLLEDIQDIIKITILGNKVETNEELNVITNLGPVESEFNEKIGPIENINYIDNYLGNLFLKEKIYGNEITPLKYRLKIKESLLLIPDEEQVDLGDEIYISKNNNHFNYYSNVLFAIIYIYNVSLKINNKDPIEDEFNDLKIFYKDLLVSPVSTKFIDNPTPEQMREINEKFILNLSLTKEQLKEREDKYKKLYPKIVPKFENIISKTYGEFTNNYLNDIKKMLDHLEKKIDINEKKTLENLNSMEFDFDIEYKYLSIPKFDTEPKLSLLGNISAKQFIKDAVELIKLNVNSIMRSKNINIELLNNNLKSISQFSKKYLETKDDKVKDEKFEEYKTIHRIKEILTNFIYQINNADIETLQELKTLNMENYRFDNNIIIDNIVGNPSFEGFSDIHSLNLKVSELKKKMRNFKNKNLNNTIEKFSNMDFHKHTDSGTIQFDKNFDLDNQEWYEKNKSLVDDFSYLDGDNKNDLINSLNKMEKSILSSNDTIKSVVNVYASFDPNKMNNSIEESIEMEENDLNRSRSFGDVLKYQNREKEQEEKIKRLNTKISDLENIQNKIYDLNSNNYKSIKSLGDGQILGIQNKGENEYTIYANNGCVGIDSSENVKMVSCGSGKRFNLHNISNEEEYSKLIKNKELENSDEIKYPFQVLKPTDIENKCLNMRGNTISIQECENSKNQRWEAFQKESKCN